MIDELIERMKKGDRRATARLITLVENDEEKAREIIRKIYPLTGNAYIVGITGPPGAGKSTLLDKLIKEARKEGLIVGVIAIDPTSPFTGGALLGDRIRMQRHSTDPGVFIRSMATRGSLGGLAKATNDAIKVLDAYGCDVIFVETVGVGQVEVDIVKTADTVVLVTVPGLGDDVQTIKAGLMEIADIFVINKADKEGADATYFELNLALDLESDKWRELGWRPPVVETVATMNKGIKELWDKIKEHREFLERSGRLKEKRRKRIEEEIKTIVSGIIAGKVEASIKRGEFEEIIRRVSQKDIDPYSAADMILKEIIGGGLSVQEN
ncbi:methylmalonyl Co-A mutase-associated GTPase MeaB [Pyrococcus abyssi]|uniref:Putative GTPase PYRAB02490 n=1 Tax=Pyrococcus abyssi (strain GE5 / Orsay) TaxID=272844 RepID=Y249_PYRAB|nr:methylmalonyl Co-A mutase-associated GTPase MeaB [Pyrococcus abyssi]Q9V225.1 RecName: Full=Putative GTPase PYRAB02490 [Pyrococcus abyssi GE5]CAB49173.1 Lysine arginine ornithine transport system kinase [Pyrococcus abyssi GE5]CCE69626.1 TPA: lysine arginine ornithine transport system kinase [Pyrococcus abyssi GE5]